MPDMLAVEATLVVVESRHYPYYVVRLKKRKAALVGELEIPLRIKVDRALLTQRTATQHLELPAAVVAAAIEGSR